MKLDRPILLQRYPYTDNSGTIISPTPLELYDIDPTFHINTKNEVVYATIPDIPGPIYLSGPHNFSEVIMLTPIALENTLKQVLGEDPQAYLQKMFPRTLEADPNGPGSILSGMLSVLGFGYTNGCSCKQHAIRMNTEGPEWCESNIDTIIGWLKEESEKRNTIFVEPIAYLLVKRAIKKSRRLLSKELE